MADLGNLYFDILFRDKTAEQRKKLKAEITKDLQAKLDVGFPAPSPSMARPRSVLRTCYS